MAKSKAPEKASMGSRSPGKEAEGMKKAAVSGKSGGPKGSNLKKGAK